MSIEFHFLCLSMIVSFLPKLLKKLALTFCSMFRQLDNFHESSIQFSNNIQGAKKRRLGEAQSIPISNGISKYLRYPLI